MATISLVEVVALGILDDAIHPTDCPDYRDDDAEKHAEPTGPELPGSRGGLLQDEPHGRWVGEGGGSEAHGTCNMSGHVEILNVLALFTRLLNLLSMATNGHVGPCICA